MHKLEKKACNWITNNCHILFFIIISILATLIRFKGLNFISGDMQYFLIPWFEEIQNNGGLNALSHQVGNYNILYQSLISIMTYFNINCVYQYKALSILFDYILALSLAFGICIFNKKQLFGLEFNITYTLVLFAPITIFNSAYWGQCDSIYTTFIVLTLIFLYREKYRFAFIFLGVAFAFKFQAIFIIPFIVCYYFYKKNFSIILFLLSLFVFWASGFLGFLHGRNLFDPFTIYLDQTSTYPEMYKNINSFWLLIGDNYEYLSSFAIFITLVLCGLALYLILSKHISIKNNEYFLNIACWFVWTCVLFLPAMHERYTYPVDILLIWLSLTNTKYTKYALTSIILSSITYGNYLFNTSFSNQWLALIHVIVWLHYTYTILKSNSNP